MAKMLYRNPSNSSHSVDDAKQRSSEVIVVGGIGWQVCPHTCSQVPFVPNVFYKMNPLW